MHLPRAAPIAAGALALLATVAELATHIVASTQTAAPSVRTTAIAAAALQILALVAVGWIYVSHFWTAGRPRSRARVAAETGLGATCCLAAAAASVVTIIGLGSADARPPPSSRSPPPSPSQLFVGCAATLGVALVCQAAFLGVHLATTRDSLVPSSPGSSDESSPDEEKRKPATLVHVKSIPYSTTTTAPPRSIRSMSFETTGSTIGGRSRSNTVNTVNSAWSARSGRSSISQANHPPSVKANKHVPPMPLAPGAGEQRNIRRAISLDSSLRPNLLRPEDAYTAAGDSWEVASVDGLRLDVSRPTSRFLETIPASPTVSSSRAPSPSAATHAHSQSASELGVPRAVRRSRSCSPLPTRESLCASPTPSLPPYAPAHANTSEAHIHPLFRSDSPIPPPAATPGTVVVASPDAGRILASRQSIQSLKRLRSGSLPPAPSPLGRHGAFEDFAVATQRYPPGRHRSRSQASSEARSSEEMIPSIVEPPAAFFGRPSSAALDWAQQPASRSSVAGSSLRRSGESEDPRG
jgi:hypothetical protein